MLNMTALEKQFTQFEKNSSGTLGISAVHIESGREINYKHDQSFLMCSTAKLPLAIHLLSQAEKGKINLNEIYMVHDTDLRTGYAFTLNDFDMSIGFPISLRNLLLMMLRESCNTSTDILLKKVGGPLAVTAYLKEMGIHHMHLDRYVLEIIAASDGVRNIPADHRCTLEQYKLLESTVSSEELNEAKKHFSKDTKDRATPQAMTLLLTKIFREELLNTTNTTWLLKTLRRNKLYPNRLMGLLPQRTPVAHKTGTATGYTNDVGIITLPHDSGHIAITVYIKDSSQEKTHNERILAEVARTIYDCFLCTQ